MVHKTGNINLAGMAAQLARCRAVGLSAQHSEEGPLDTLPSAAAQTRTNLRPSHLFYLCAATPRAVSTHHGKERQEVLQTEPGQVEGLHLQPDHQWVPGCTAKSLGLILLFHLLFYGLLAALFSCTMCVLLQILNNEIPKDHDQIPSSRLKWFSQN